MPARIPDHFMAMPGSYTVLGIIADKWTTPVIHALARGGKRFGELHRQLAGVSQKMLTQTLRNLEAHGLVTRTVHAVVPPRVDYALTPLGRSLNEPLTELCRWVLRHGPAVEEARKRLARKAG